MTIPDHLNQAPLPPSLLCHCVRSEIRLWKNLRYKKTGTRFVRQKAVGDYLFPFYCKELKLAIELSHTSSPETNPEKETFLEWNGIDVLHFEEKDVIKNTELVTNTIREYVKKKRKEQYKNRK